MLRYAITGGFLTDVRGPETDRLLARCEQLAAQDIDFLLLREKALNRDQIAALTHLAVTRTAGSPLRVLVHTHADIALAEGAAGVHVSHAAAIPEIHRVFPQARVSVACHTLADIHAARAQHASAGLFAPVFGKSVAGVEVVPPAGLDLLRQACDAACSPGPKPPISVFALGGITPQNASSCIAAGAAGIAGIRLFFPR